MPELTIVYETYGTLAPDGRNAVLLTHGFTSSQHMAGRYSDKGAEGSWSGLVGPGKAIDTDKLFVVASNMLGSPYGSTSPAHLNPRPATSGARIFPTSPWATSSTRRRRCSTASASSIWWRSPGHRTAATRPSSGA